MQNNSLHIDPELDAMLDAITKRAVLISEQGTVFPIPYMKKPVSSSKKRFIMKLIEKVLSIKKTN